MFSQGSAGSVAVLTTSGKGGWNCTEMHRSNSTCSDTPVSTMSKAEEATWPRSKSSPLFTSAFLARLREEDGNQGVEDQDAGEVEVDRVMSTSLPGGVRSPSAQRGARSSATSPLRPTYEDEHHVFATAAGSPTSRRTYSRHLPSHSGRLKMELTSNTDTGGVRVVPCSLSCSEGGEGSGEVASGGSTVHEWSDFDPLILLQDNVKVCDRACVCLGWGSLSVYVCVLYVCVLWGASA